MYKLGAAGLRTTMIFQKKAVILGTLYIFSIFGEWLCKGREIENPFLNIKQCTFGVSNMAINNSDSVYKRV